MNQAEQLQLYGCIMKNTFRASARRNPDATTLKGRVVHLLWMLENMPDDAYKYNRWLGFIQGCLATLGLRTIQQMREDNRS